MDPITSNILLVWLTFFGACIGSFLNVVIYRLPRGKSLSNPPSHCPKCGHAIRWYDNVPVLGWLWLGGKCRDCQEPISIRYPIVESVGGLVFGTIAYLTLQRDVDASLFELFLFVLGMSGLVLTFFAAGLIEKDDQKIPWKLFLPAMVLILPWMVIRPTEVFVYGIAIVIATSCLHFLLYFFSPRQKTITPLMILAAMTFAMIVCILS